MGRRRWLVRSDVFLWVGVVFGLGVGLRLWQGMEMEAGAEMPSRIVLTRETLQARIEAARSDAGAATDHEHKTKLEEYLSQLTELNGAILPA